MIIEKGRRRRKKYVVLLLIVLAMLTSRWTKDRRGLCYLSLFLSTKLAAEITVYRDENGEGGKEKSGWSSTAIRLNEAGRERGSFIGNQSMISQGIISVRFEREKLLHRVEQIKFLTNASLNGLALYCSFNPVPCFRTNPCESLMNSYDSGRETPRIFINIGKKFALRIGSISWTSFHHV